MSLKVEPIATRIFRLNESLSSFVLEHLTPKDGEVICITSKIVSLSEGQVVSKSELSKSELVRNEADIYLGEAPYGCHLTIKHGLFIPSAGIDESNSQSDSYILFPKNPFKSAESLWHELFRRSGVKNFGVLITDSHTTPLRRGVTGIALAYWGFKGVESFVGRDDIFGRKLQMTHVNTVDALASAAVLCMGEAAEKCPLAVIKYSKIKFTNVTDQRELQIPLTEDIYGRFFRS